MKSTMIVTLSKYSQLVSAMILTPDGKLAHCDDDFTESIVICQRKYIKDGILNEHNFKELCDVFHIECDIVHIVTGHITHIVSSTTL